MFYSFLWLYVCNVILGIIPFFPFDHLYNIVVLFDVLILYVFYIEIKYWFINFDWVIFVLLSVTFTLTSTSYLFP